MTTRGWELEEHLPSPSDVYWAVLNQQETKGLPFLLSSDILPPQPLSPKQGFLKLRYAYNEWPSSHCSAVHGLSTKKNRKLKNKIIVSKCSYVENLIKQFLFKFIK
jgi:hypothetical protein